MTIEIDVKASHILQKYQRTSAVSVKSSSNSLGDRVFYSYGIKTLSDETEFKMFLVQVQVGTDVLGIRLSSDELDEVILALMYVKKQAECAFNG